MLFILHKVLLEDIQILSDKKNLNRIDFTIDFTCKTLSKKKLCPRLPLHALPAPPSLGVVVLGIKDHKGTSLFQECTMCAGGCPWHGTCGCH